MTRSLTSDLSRVHTSNNVEATLSNATSRTIYSIQSNVASTLLPFFSNNVERNFVLSTKSKHVEHAEPVLRKISRKTRSTLLQKTATMSKQHSTLSKGRNFTIKSFIVAVGNNVECFDIVARVNRAHECSSVTLKFLHTQENIKNFKLILGKYSKSLVKK